MIRFLILLLLSTGLVFSQVTVFPFFGVLLSLPPLLPLIAFGIALQEPRPYSALVLGGVSGFFSDLFSPFPFGLWVGISLAVILITRRVLHSYGRFPILAKN